MKAVATSYCVDCGNVFYVSTDSDATLLPNMRAVTRFPRRDYLLTWAEWVFHVMNYCPDCRFSQPPTACLEDLEKHAAKLRKEIKDKSR